jgi:predicted negative regulator of RcsB-dependent stress response
MATYKKRGYKPKTEKEQEDIEKDGKPYVEGESTTQEVFDNLDEGAGKTEEWVAENQKPIFIFIGIVVVAVLGYLGYQRFVNQPKELEAANEIAQSQVYFENALDASGKAQDSLYNLALTGGNGKYGFVEIADNYGSTDAGNLANYYAGMAYLKTGKYDKAINHLESFSSEDEILAPLAKGAIGDAFMQLEQPEEALGYYESAANMRSNDFTTPKFLLKAAITAIGLGEGEKAEGYLTTIEDEYSEAPEAEKVAVYMGQAKARK